MSDDEAENHVCDCGETFDTLEALREHAEAEH